MINIVVRWRCLSRQRTTICLKNWGVSWFISFEREVTVCQNLKQSQILTDDFSENYE